MSPTVAGVDVGYSYVGQTTGLCRTTAGGGAFVVGHTYADCTSRHEMLVPDGLATSFDVVAIDGPLLPRLRGPQGRRACERTFVCKPFKGRAEPGEVISPRGAALARAASDAARHVAPLTASGKKGLRFPQVVAELPIVEAFPDAFLAILLPEEVHEEVVKGAKDRTDLFFEAANAQGALGRLLDELQWEDPALHSAMMANQHHEDRSGLICALTAICVYRGRYTAVGDTAGGWFFLPPWDHWQHWAQEGVRKGDVEVWRDGEEWLERGGPPAPDVAEVIQAFFERVHRGEIEIYNEASFQLELALILRSQAPASQPRVYLELPFGQLRGLKNGSCAKKEIDLLLGTGDAATSVPIELKYPRNGQYPEQMFKFCQDIRFLEQLVEKGCPAGYFVVVVDDRLFYEGSTDGIYGHFRGQKPIHGTILKPTGARDEVVQLSGSYRIDWREVGDGRRYACVRVSPDTLAGKG